MAVALTVTAYVPPKVRFKTEPTELNNEIAAPRRLVPVEDEVTVIVAPVTVPEGPVKVGVPKVILYKPALDVAANEAGVPPEEELKEVAPALATIVPSTKVETLQPDAIRPEKFTAPAFAASALVLIENNKQTKTIKYLNIISSERQPRYLI